MTMRYLPLLLVGLVACESASLVFRSAGSGGRGDAGRIDPSQPSGVTPGGGEPTPKTFALEDPPQVFGDSEFVAGIFTEVFGPSLSAETLRMNIYCQTGSFGGGNPVDEDALVDATHFELPNGGCHVATVRAGSAQRSAFTLKTCEAAVTNPTALAYALNRASLRESDAPDATSIAKAYALFFAQGTPPPNEKMIQALSELAGASQTPLEKWQLIFLALCANPSWQVL